MKSKKQKRDKERESEVRPLQVLAFHLPTTVDKEPKIFPFRFI